MSANYTTFENDILFNWYKSLMDKSISMVTRIQLQNRKVDFYKQEFLKQFFTHFLSIEKLSKGLEIILDGKENKISALPSVATLVRACIENYSMFYFIYRDSDFHKEREFRFWSWYREGLINRQRFKVKRYTQKKEQEKMTIDGLTEKLMNDEFFLKLSPKKKKQFVTRGKWFFLSKKQLLTLSGFSETLADNFYNYLSSYTHPTSASHLQTSQASYKDSMNMQGIIMKALFISSGLYLHNYSLEFPLITNNFQNEDVDFIQSWCEFGNKLMK